MKAKELPSPTVLSAHTRPPCWTTLDDGEPQADAAAVVAGSLPEPVEEVFQVLGGDACPGVFHGEAHALPVGHRAQCDPAAARRELHRQSGRWGARVGAWRGGSPLCPADLNAPHSAHMEPGMRVPKRLAGSSSIGDSVRSLSL